MARSARGTRWGPTEDGRAGEGGGLSEQAIVEALPGVAPDRVAEILAGPVTPEEHERWQAALPLFDRVEVAPPPSPGRAGAGLRIGAWNAERGRHPEAAAGMLGAVGADVWLLSELDVGMARTGQRHTARDLAERLGWGFAYGVEFLELGLGDESERAAHAGEHNAQGLHGGAILSALPLLAPEVVRLDDGGGWWDGHRGERRVGGRMAVVASLALAGGGELCLASVHLENHCDPAERAAQLGVVIDAVEARVGAGPAVIGGDLNTHSLDTRALEDREALARALAADPERLAAPIRHEPLFERAAAAGFAWQACNRVGESTHRTAEGRGSMRLDWLLCRGLRATGPAVVAAVDPASGAPLSDHEAVVARFGLA